MIEPRFELALAEGERRKTNAAEINQAIENRRLKYFFVLHE